MQEYVPAGNGDASGEYADRKGSFTNFGKKAQKETKSFESFGKSVDLKAEKEYNKDEEKFLSDFENGTRYSYEELLQSPIVKRFEEKRKIAQEMAFNKKPLSEEERSNYAKRFLEKAKNAPKNYRADIVMGLPAAGKSTAVVNSLKEKYGSFEFDNDEIKKLLPGYEEYGASYAHEDSKDVQEKALNSFLKDGELNGINLAIPIIGSDYKKVNSWINKMQNAGYEIHLHHVGISNEESLNRSVNRAIKTGRYVPLDKIKKEYSEKPKEVYERLKKKGRKGVIFDD